MVRTRFTMALSLTSLALALATGACKKDEKNADPANLAKSVAEPGGGASADDLSLLPVDSEVVVGLNFQQLQGSMLWKKFAEPKLLAGEAQEQFGQFKDKCGFDPFLTIKSVSVGLKGVGGGAKPEGAVVIHGPEKAKVMACFEKMKAEAAKDGVTLDTDGDVIAITTKDGDKLAFTFINDTTALGVIGANGTVAGVKAAAAGRSALKTSPAFVEMYSKINTKESLWMLVNGSKALDAAASLGVKPDAVFGSVNVTDGLSVDLRMRLKSQGEAAQLVGLAKSQEAQAKAFVDKLEFTSDGPEVRVVIALSSKKLADLIAQFGGMLGMGSH